MLLTYISSLPIKEANPLLYLFKSYFPLVFSLPFSIPQSASSCSVILPFVDSCFILFITFSIPLCYPFNEEVNGLLHHLLISVVSFLLLFNFIIDMDFVIVRYEMKIYNFASFKII